MIYVALSIALHLAFFVPVLMSGKEEQKNEKEGQGSSQIEIAIIVPKESKPAEIVLSEKSEDGIKQKEVPKRKSDSGFYGIGVFIGMEYVAYGHYVYSGYRVNEVFSGYAAEKYGLRKGDVIFLIDGMPISEENDVKGDGPRKMVLTIKRNEQFVDIYVERDYVQTERQGN